MIIAISGKINSGKDLIGEIILYLTDRYYHSKVGGEASFENWGASNIHSSGYDIGHKSMYEVNNTDHFVIKKFADKLKDIVCILLGCTREQLEDEKFKNTELGEEWNKWCMENHWIHTDTIEKEYYLTEEDAKWFRDSVKNKSYYAKAYKVKMTPRLLLQLLGTDCGRQIIHPNIWVNALMSEYKGIFNPEKYYLAESIKDGLKPDYPNWIITDTRFPNELEAVKDKGGITIRVNRFMCSKCGNTDNFEGGNDLCNECGHFKSNDKEHESETALDNAEFDYVIDNNGTIEELIDKVREILVKQKLL